MVAIPYGSWTSPITSDLIVADAILLDQIALDGDAIYWSESQPHMQGRTFIYCLKMGGRSGLLRTTVMPSTCALALTNTAPAPLPSGIAPFISRTSPIKGFTGRTKGGNRIQSRRRTLCDMRTE
jgi:hypothetical protein